MIEITNLYPNQKPRKPRVFKKRAVRPHKPRTAPKKVKRKPDTKKATLASYGLPASYKSSNLRYGQPIERGILWYWFSKFIRERDRELPCISCGNHKPEYHGGHFIAAGAMSADEMVFNEMNVSAECPFCNLRDKAKLKYAYNLDRRYGPGTAQKLRDAFNEYKFGGKSYKNWNRDEYKEKIARYRRLLEELGDNASK